jgi:hypothetical protein
MEIVDVSGKKVAVGKKVAFAGGGRGASEFYVGEIVKLNKKTIVIEYDTGKTHHIYDSGKWQTTTINTVQRLSGKFSLILPEIDLSLLGKSQPRATIELCDPEGLKIYK